MRELQVDFRLKAIVWHDEAVNVFVSHCPALNLYTQGDSEDESKEAMSEGVRTFLEVCYHRKILDNIMVDEGFAPVGMESDGVPIHDDGKTEVITVREKAIRDSATSFPVEIPFHFISRAKSRAAGAGDGKCQ